MFAKLIKKFLDINTGITKKEKANKNLKNKREKSRQSAVEKKTKNKNFSFLLSFSYVFLRKS